MNILAIMADNAARRATLTVTPLADGMLATALQNDKTSNVCRAAGPTIKVVVVFDRPELISGANMRCNLSPSSLMQLVSFSDAEGTSQLQDSGLQSARPWPDIAPKGNWTASQWASAYQFGGGAMARGFLPSHVARRLEITIQDPDNLQGYPELVDLFVGRAWTPSRSPDYNPSLSAASSNESFRDGAGGLRSIKGTKFKRMALSLSHMSEADRTELWGVQLANGTDVPMITSLYPGAGGARERDHQMYCCLVETSAMRRPNFAEHATEVQWQSM